MQSVRVLKAVEGPEAFQGSDAAPVGAGDGRDAGADGPSVEQHGARAALAESAAESRAVELEILLQNQQQGSRWVVNGYGGILPVDLQSISGHSGVRPPRSTASRIILGGTRSVNRLRNWQRNIGRETLLKIATSFLTEAGIVSLSGGAICRQLVWRRC